MKRLVVAIDCDDVIIPSTEHIVAEYNCRFTTSVPLVSAHDGKDPNWQASREEIAKRIYEIQQSDAYRKTSPFQDAVESCKKLASVHELHLVTARPESLLDVTRTMVNEYFPKVFTSIEHVGLGGDKGKMCKAIGADVLVDDNVKHLESARRSGISNLLWFGDYEWNQSEQEPAGVLRCINWAAVVQQIEHIANE